MPGFRQPRRKQDRDPHQGGLLVLLIERWAQQAMERPWWYATTWGIGIGAANFGLRMLLNDLSAAQNARLAALTALGLFLFAWLYTAQLTRPLRRQHAARPAAPPAGCAAGWRPRRPGGHHRPGQGPRSGALWSCPRRHRGLPARHASHASARSNRWIRWMWIRWMRRLIIAILAITAVAVALLVGATRAQAERPHPPTCSDRQQGTDSRPEQPHPARR